MTMEIRYEKCNRKQAEGMALNLAIKCPRCKMTNRVWAASPCVEGHGASNSEAKRGNNEAALPSTENR